MALKAHTPRERTDKKFAAADHIGRLVAITVNEVLQVQTQYKNKKYPDGIKPALRADVTICDGIIAGADYGDVLIFTAGLVADLKDCEPGETVVGRIAVEANPGVEDTYVLDVPTADDFAAAQEFFLEF